MYHKCFHKKQTTLHGIRNKRPIEPQGKIKTKSKAENLIMYEEIIMSSHMRSSRRGKGCNNSKDQTYRK